VDGELNSQTSGTASPGIKFFVCSTKKKLLVLKRTAVPSLGHLGVVLLNTIWFM